MNEPILPPNNCGPGRQLDRSDTKVKTQKKLLRTHNEQGEGF